MISNVIISLVAALAVSPLASAAPTHTVVEKRAPTAVTAVVYAQVLPILPGGLIEDLCLTVNVPAGESVPLAIDTAVGALLGPLATSEICLAVGAGQTPTCDDGGALIQGTGCGFACLPGFELTQDGLGCVAINASLAVRRRMRQRSKRSLCPSDNETACRLNGSSAPLTNSMVVSHNYACFDLNNSVDSCGACGNVCQGENAGCENGECVILS